MPDPNSQQDGNRPVKGYHDKKKRYIHNAEATQESKTKKRRPSLILTSYPESTETLPSAHAQVENEPDWLLENLLQHENELRVLAVAIPEKAPDTSLQHQFHYPEQNLLHFQKYGTAEKEGFKYPDALPLQPEHRASVSRSLNSISTSTATSMFDSSDRFTAVISSTSTVATIGFADALSSQHSTSMMVMDADEEKPPAISLHSSPTATVLSAVKEAAPVDRKPLPEDGFIGCDRARRLELSLQEGLRKAREATAKVEANADLKKLRREVQKKLNVHVQQISATWDQVRQKVSDLRDFLREQSAASSAVGWPEFVLLTMAEKFVGQCDLVKLNEAAAFPIAFVLKNLSAGQAVSSADQPASISHLLPLTLALLQEQCHYAVPKAPRGGGGGGTAAGLSDAALAKMEGAMLMFGALVQVLDPGFGWTFLAWFMRGRLPAGRASGRSLGAVLRMAGYGIYKRYGQQFEKLLDLLSRTFLKSLSAAAAEDTEASAAAAILSSYIQDRRYRDPPTGLNMPKSDLSSQMKADEVIIETRGGRYR